MNFSKLSSPRHVITIKKCSGIKLRPNQLIILLSSYGQHIWVTYENTQITCPGQPSAFTVIQVSGCDDYTLDWCEQATRLREMESKKQ